MASISSLQFRDRLNYGLLAIAVMLILMTSFISVRSASALRDSIDRVHVARMMKESISDFRTASGENETFALRYLITSSEEYLMQYLRQTQDLDTMLAQLDRLTKANPDQAAQVSRLTKLHRLRAERSKIVLEAKLASIRERSNARVEALIRDGTGARIILGVRSLLEQLATEQDRLLVMRIEESDDLVKQANATVLTANGLALVAGILGFVALRRAQRESERSLRHEVKALQANRANEEKSAFLANMSHEIRTPMNAIFGFTQLLSESVTAPIEREWVQSIKKSGQLLLTLINNVLDLSKIEAGKFQLHPHATNIKQTVQETVEMFSALAADKGIALTFEIEEANLCNIDIDAPRLRQVMMNLVSNAVKYTELGGVVLRAQMLPSVNANVRDLRFMVIDSGVGIPDEQRARIFEPFHQADSPDGKLRQGTGLGLSITRRLVDMMEGRISVESELGRGSTFIVNIPQLPVSTTPATAPARDEQLVDFNRLRPLKILVVDDMAWNAQVAQGYLGKSHHRVFVASDGIDGVAAAKKLHPDVVLMDLRMPRMNGFEARDAIRADPDLTDTSIVAVTASSLGGEEHSLRASFDGYIRKPFTPIDLFVSLQAIFGASAASEPMQLGIANLTAPPQKVTPQLQQRWFGLRTVKLIELRRTMRMREISSFALELGVLGRDLGWPKLIEYAAMLGNAVRRFDIVSVKKILGELAGWPEDLFDES